MKAKQKLKMIEKIVSEAESTASMDMDRPDTPVIEIRAVLDGTICEECGNPGWLRLGIGVGNHYTHCSMYVKPDLASRRNPMVRW
jgi:hypothetical protein